MSAGWSSGSTRRWRSARAACLASNARHNGGRCVLGLDGTRPCPRHPGGAPGGRGAPCRPCTAVATHAHHPHGEPGRVVPWTQLQAVCGPCNLHVGDPTAWRPVHRVVTRW
jgi:5-methylcytosine-specific restriction endonuclease McrA